MGGSSSPSAPAPLPPPPAEDLGGKKKSSPTVGLQDKRRKGAAPLIVGGLGSTQNTLATAFKSLLGQ
jgi:hypothetical protein